MRYVDEKRGSTVMAAQVSNESKKTPPAAEMAEFLESYPPGSLALVGAERQADGDLKLRTPDIQLHCSSEKCQGLRIFRCADDRGGLWLRSTMHYLFLSYLCRNCERSSRVYALSARAATGNFAEVYKLGEVPSFGPPVPARVITLVGPDRELFLKGRRVENQGFGMGAFAYYRRVVDQQWRRLVAEIIRVAERVGVAEAMLTVLRDAAAETQFNRAVDLIRDAIPETLRINGHNPLTLLYAALSEGIHDKSDEECLELATSIRVVLTELAERIGQALKDEQELQDAVSRLLTRKGAQGSNMGRPPAAQ